MITAATPKQIAALKYLIFIAKDGTELTKRVLAFLIDQSESLTKDVCLTLVENVSGYSADEINKAVNGFHAMLSCNCTTHLDRIIVAMGGEVLPSYHFGDFDPSRTGDPFNSDGIFPGFPEELVCAPKERIPGLVREGMPLRYTFWLAKGHYSRKATLVKATRGELEAIDLQKPGFYPESEETANRLSKDQAARS